MITLILFFVSLLFKDSNIFQLWRSGGTDDGETPPGILILVAILSIVEMAFEAACILHAIWSSSGS
jgi:hypothetical protein